MSSRDLASLAINPHRNLTRWILGSLLAAAVFISLACLPQPLASLLAVMLCGVATWQAWRLGVLGRRYRLECIQCDSHGDWWLFPSGAASIRAVLMADSHVTTHAVWARWDTARGSYRALFARHELHPRDWRELQARLRLLPLNSAEA